MATSAFPTKQYTSEQFVESCGAVLFNFIHAPRRVCLINYIKTNEWLLPKGRRNCGESRCDAAFREVQEETSYECYIQPMSIPSRTTRPNDNEHVPDEARLCRNIEEPFMLTVRELGGDAGVKIIWWFIAGVEPSNHNGMTKEVSESDDFRAEFFDYGDALRMLKFQTDREVLGRAIELVEGSRIV
ncbi:hypothetical protein BDV06DRAFT_204663 [Aspergillus oleicola]